VHPKRDDGARTEFIEEIKKIGKEQLVFLDELGIEDNAIPLYGWSTKGTRCYDKRAYRHKRRVSMIAGLCNGNIIAPIIFEGTCDTEVFLSYTEQILIKELTPGQTVVMDNINFHKNPKVKELIESVGCKIIFLPTYSPDLNPIEHYWFKIKHQIRKVASKFQEFFEAVSAILHKVCTL
jgi:transposase